MLHIERRDVVLQIKLYILLAARELCGWFLPHSHFSYKIIVLPDPVNE